MTIWEGYKDIKALGKRNNPLRVDRVSKELKLSFSDYYGVGGA